MFQTSCNRVQSLGNASWDIGQEGEEGWRWFQIVAPVSVERSHFLRICARDIPVDFPIYI